MRFRAFTRSGGGTGGGAGLVSPVFTGNPTAPTPAPGDNDTSLATTAFVTAADVVVAASVATTYAPKASPVFTGNPTAPTAAPGDNDTSIATTAFVTAAVGAGGVGGAPIDSPTFTGDPKAPTPTQGDNDTSIATTAFVTTAAAAAVSASATAAAGLYAPIASPTLTGDPKAPTASPGDNDTSIATTAFVTAADVVAVAAAATAAATIYAPKASPVFTGNPTAPTASPGDNDTSIATTAFATAADAVITAAVAATYAPLASPALTGNPTSPTPAVNDNDTSIATTAFVTAADVVAVAAAATAAATIYAPKASPVFTGNPTAPTAAPGDNDTSIATTAFVTAAVGVGGVGGAPINSPTFTGDPKAPTPSPGDNDTSIATTAFVTAADTAAVAAAVASAATAAAALYLPGPVPVLSTWLQAKVDAGQPADWVWGNYTIPAAITVNFNASSNGFRFDGHGATFTAGFTNTAVDLITFIVPDTAPSNTNVISPQIANMSFNCGAQNKVRNGLVLSCKLNTLYLFGVEIVNVGVWGASASGILLYGDVFEADIIGCMLRDNARAGLEMRNPTFGGNGIISSVGIFGGDYRTNKYGIMTSADTTYQEPAGFYVIGANFIANLSAGIFCFAGMKICRDSHFENNCGSNGGETNGAIWNVFGPINIDNCDAASSTGNGQHYLVDCLGQSAQSCHINRSTCINTDTGVGRKIGKLAGNGTLWIGNSIAATDFDATGAWVVNRADVTSTTIP